MSGQRVMAVRVMTAREWLSLVDQGRVRARIVRDLERAVTSRAREDNPDARVPLPTTTVKAVKFPDDNGDGGYRVPLLLATTAEVEGAEFIEFRAQIVVREPVGASARR